MLAVLESLKTNPLPVPAHWAPRFVFGVVTYKSAKSALFTSLYSPLRVAFLITEAFAFAEKGDARFLLVIWHEGESLKCEDWCAAQYWDPSSWNDDAVSAAIACGDADAIDDTEEELQVCTHLLDALQRAYPCNL